MKLGILDQSHICEGRTAADALTETTKLAQEADRLGYTRYWISEHHASKSLAHSSPEVLIAHLAAATSRIRVGSGGVMLPHYSAYKVAENFRLLEALHPGRIDLGLGRAPGGVPLATRALQEGKAVDIDQYPQQVADLTGYLHDALPTYHRFARLQASPSISTAPELWLLGSSDESAKIAARQGAGYGFAQFFGAPGGEEAMRYYQENFRPSVLNERPQSLVAVLVICAETEEEANRLAMSMDLFFLRLERGMELHSLPSVETAMDYPYTEYDFERIRQGRQRRVIGTPVQVKEKLLMMSEHYRTDEFLVVTPTHDFTARIRSYQLLAEAFGLQLQG
ncbi:MULTISPECIES: LLM class flavin-dependent oxidoreductase [unclassified Paenibacillus]|uniref:LLM class flavin-dependent oxidoreductase n=1 Tax=unclassified Paenibacillus TaxID=185978 RepID=UPI001AE20239|nr:MULTISPECIES: LLM class flavin-dependent oxidoreductase [unclassified Paenibacillus]MBP1155008.1 luciferase family oxidoreductase group 1 [Paenibacillus sp. PvP091]MBP1169609.1 luciferase family oxidoreductase group 1 [Paenibacillus sp. PvR098]MBP2440637.1 luciferase family oxidoreductase group 1 [Paenibacillus sp. PvP052]